MCDASISIYRNQNREETRLKPPGADLRLVWRGRKANQTAPIFENLDEISEAKIAIAEAYKTLGERGRDRQIFLAQSKQEAGNL